MDLAVLNAPLVKSALWLLLAAVAVLVWWLGRDRPVPRRFGGALWCLVVAIVVEAVMPWFTPGDWIRFASHLGRVQGIGWRSTQLITRNLEVLDVPNGLLAREVVTNCRGDAIGDELFVSASYKTPPNVTKRVIVEVLREVA